jgi:dihydrofolate reductase
MRKLKLQVQLSIDGFIASENGKTDWLLWNWGPEWTWDDALKKYFIELTASVDCVLLSRKMAEEGFIAHWEGVATNLNTPQAAFAKSIAAAEKIVFSKTLINSVWKKAVLAKRDLAEQVNDLKKQDGKDIIVYGGASFLSSLIKARLVDEFYLFINPVVLGNGKPIFRDIAGSLNLLLVEAQHYSDGMVVLHYASKTIQSLTTQ